MPARLNAKGPGEFIRDHLQDPQTGGRDYVGAMYQAYKEHLRTAGIRHLPCRPVFHKYIWLLKETGAIIFDGAEAISFGSAPPQPLPPAYELSCGMPAPRHYYRILDPQNPAFGKPEAVWRQHRGLAPIIPTPRPVQIRVVTQPITPAPPREAAPVPPAPPPKVQAPTLPRRRRRWAGAAPAGPARRLTVAERMEEEARAFLPRIEALRTTRDLQELDRLDEEMVGFFDRVLDTAERSRGENKQQLLALAQRFEKAAESFEQARAALADSRTGDYLAALDSLARCCPEDGYTKAKVGPTWTAIPASAGFTLVLAVMNLCFTITDESPRTFIAADSLWCQISMCSGYNARARCFCRVGVPERAHQKGAGFMDKKAVKLWYDPEADFLEVILEQGVGVAEDTEDERVEVRVDEGGKVLSFHILGLKSIEGPPFWVELRPKKKAF